MRLPLLYYYSKIYWLLFLLVVSISGTVFLTSCAASKSSFYFKNINKDTILKGFTQNDFESMIKKRDILGITVSSVSKEMDERFNIFASVSGSAQSSIPGYLVNDQGLITVHYAGSMIAAGLTRKALKEKLEISLLPYFKDPIVTVQYLNHKVTVLGEVNRPQVINMPEEQVSLIDVIVGSGDVKEGGSRGRIMIIREEKNEKIVKYVNLEDDSIFSSSWYYLKPNDIVYVLPDSEKYVKEEKRKKFQTTLSLVASMASLVVIVLNIILR